MSNPIQPPAPMTFAKRRAAERAAERARARRLNTPVPAGPDGEDHGMDLGPAALARGGRLERVDGRIRGAGQQQATPVYARMVDASTLFERMNQVSQLSDRQAKAGHRLWLLKRAAGIDARVTARYPVTATEPASDLDADESEVIESACPEGWDPRTYHRWVLRQVSAHAAQLLDRGCDWTPEHRVGHPGVRWLGVFQTGLDRLADIWSIKDA